MLLLLIILIGINKGVAHLRDVIKIFIRHLKFWLLAGSIGFGMFYSFLCYAADHAPGWVVAGTWQITVIATPVVLLFFKEKVPRRGVYFSVLIFIGIFLLQFYNKESQFGVKHIVYGVIPVVIAAFAFPIGNQLLNFAKHGNHSLIPHIDSPILHDASTCVLLMTLGSIPFWALLLLWVAPPPPLKNQLINTFIVAVSSGIIGTSIFYKARNSSKSPYVISGVDATQAGGIVFSLVGEMLLLNGALPQLTGVVGIILIVVGIIGYSLKKY
jgi:drug/metabolite transporter (DMT)-like permease